MTLTICLVSGGVLGTRAPRVLPTATSAHEGYFPFLVSFSVFSVFSISPSLALMLVGGVLRIRDACKTRAASSPSVYSHDDSTPSSSRPFFAIRISFTISFRSYYFSSSYSRTSRGAYLFSLPRAC